MTTETESIVDALRASMSEHSEPTESETVAEDDQPEVSDPVEEVEAAEEPEGIPEVAEAEDDHEEPEQVFQAPEHWSSDEKEQFNALSPEAQEILLERDKAFQKGYQERVQAISDIEKAIEPWKQVLAQRGVSEADAIRTLFAAQAQIEQNPAQGILALARQFGVEDQLKSQFVPDTDDDDFTDPEVKALRDQIKQLEQRLGETTQGIEQSQTQALQEQINAFANAKNDDGELLHPHFNDVRHLMAPIVQQGKTLDEAYEQVVWAVPEYREAFLKAKEKPNEVDKARRVKEAKRAAKAIKPKGKSPEEDVELSLKDELTAAWKQLA